MTNTTTHDQAAFQACLDELEAARQNQHKALRERLGPHLTVEELDAWDVEWDQVNDRYRQQVRELHKEFGVPLLQPWEKALDETGKTIYHQVHHPFEGQQIQATIERDAQTGRITLTTTETYTFPPTVYPTLDKIGTHISFRGAFGDYWEAVAKEDTQNSETKAQS